MKGVLLSRATQAQVVDITHDIEPQDVDGARLVVAKFWRRFPPNTVHLIVVDPGVGSERAALAVEAEGRFLVGPDNGVLSPALLAPGARAVSLRIPADAAPTFHGRDVFAPAAASLAIGVPIENLGDPMPTPVLLHTPQAQRGRDGAVEGEVIAVDRFGNAITNIIPPHDGLFRREERGARVEVGGLSLPLSRAYSEVGARAAVAVVGSSGFIEIAIRNGNAAKELGIRRGMRVRLTTAANVVGKRR